MFMRHAVILATLLLLTSCAPRSDNGKEYPQSVFTQELIEDNAKLREQNQELKAKLEGEKERLSELERLNSQLLEQVKNLKKKLPSPKDKLSVKDIQFYPDRVVLKARDAFAAVFQDTKSMEPLINKHATAIQVPVKSSDQVRVGDIIAFKANYSDLIIVHRVVKTGRDSKGWFAITKGDNNEEEDPGKVRLSQVLGVTIGIIY